MDVSGNPVRSMIRARPHDAAPAAAILATVGAGAGLLAALAPGLGLRRRALVRGGAGRWAPLLGVLAGALGVGLAGWALGRPDRPGLLRGAAARLLRGLTGRPLQRLLGEGAGRRTRRTVDFHRTFTVRAPIEEVFSSFIDFESFPRFMPHLRDVDLRGDGRMRWTAIGPAGTTLRWDADITELVPNEAIAWRSVPGERIASEGVVRFEETLDGGTRVEITMSYRSPAGALGRAIARLLGADPKRAMTEDLQGFRAFVEQTARLVASP
ncbi:SRPBCC family protein [Sorangium sp. So ce1335]|uniref:SRPBCC family protein n=1 Tax=Sorangium sp. So ce1335 TaxID=3133335 RepID=UPI003F636FBD